MTPKTQNRIVLIAFFVGIAALFVPVFFDDIGRDEDIVAAPATALSGGSETGMHETDKTE